MGSPEGYTLTTDMSFFGTVVRVNLQVGLWCDTLAPELWRLQPLWRLLGNDS